MKKHKMYKKFGIKVKKHKIKKIKNYKKIGEITRKKRMIYIIFVSLIILTGLIIRIGWIQFAMGSQLQAMAYLQQTLDRRINPKRGNIYDATGKKILAVSATVETITVKPVDILKQDKEKVARAFSEIFELDYETVLKKVNKRSSIEIIVKKVEKEKADKLRIWMKENNINYGINIDEDTKRYYPYNNMASQVLGFCGSDNQGLNGIEAKYDEQLKGKTGSIVKITDATGGDILNEGESYVSAINGNDIILTIDATIQGIAEKYLEDACIDNVCTDGGNIIIMNSKTGDILAMAEYPSYNLNDPYIPNTDELRNVWDSLSQAEKSDTLQKIWRNKAISDAYEPGSTFKLVTSSAALEEGITQIDNPGEFNCGGRIEIGGVKIRCWRHYRPHGAQSLREALMNSCNPVFVSLGQKLGVEKFYDYLERFGLLGKTGIDLPGEGSSIFLKEEKVGPIELATISFGQRFEITPIQMISAVSAIANNGTYIEPKIVKKIIDTETGEIKEIESKKRTGVISEKTAKDVLSMMESVVEDGTGRNAQVRGYSIGGKTGTSEDGVNTGKYITSFIGVAPISDPEVVILITLYNPTGEGGHQGGGVAAPIAAQVLGEVLPYLEIEKDNLLEQDIKQNIEVPNIENLTVAQAEEMLQEYGLKLEIKENVNLDFNKKDYLIKEQTPKQGVKILKGSKLLVKIHQVE